MLRGVYFTSGTQEGSPLDRLAGALSRSFGFDPRRPASVMQQKGRAYFITNALTMMADSIEHVISYWVMHERFASPALGGFAVISHWVPFLLFSVWSGALADRFDPRRLIQIGMGLFMVASAGWVAALTASLLA